MKATELRLGNLVYLCGYDEDSGGNIFHDPSGDEVCVVTLETLKDILDPPSLVIYDPIPLTEEWLVKLFNINRRNGNSWLFDFSENFTCMWDGERILIEEYSEGTFPLNHIKHVHQLQNLYFALTGEELTIKD